MKKLFILFFLLLLFGGGGYGVYDYLTGGIFFPKEQVIEMSMTEQETAPVEERYLAEIRSFKVPVLHNSVAVKFLVFHVLLNVDSYNDSQLVEQKMNNLVDMYIRYLVAHFEVNTVGDVLNRQAVNHILRSATEEVMGDTITLKNVIIQGVFQKQAGV